ncbi:MAG: fumarylacetoacetate hydrolase family protein [Gaiellaceae bacterium]
MFRPRGSDLRRGWPGRVDDDQVVQLAAQTLQSYFTGGGNAREHAVFPLDDVELLAPVLEPRSLRLVQLSKEGIGVVYGNPAAIQGPGQLAYPSAIEELDCELVLAAVAGAQGEIAGLTIMNDWTARGLERRERGAGLGAAKAKDFATSIGPLLVTPGELGEWSRLAWAVRVNGKPAPVEAIGWEPPPWRQLVAVATANTPLVAGELIGLGWPAASLARAGSGGWLCPGDKVELEVEGIGVLESVLGPPAGQPAPAPLDAEAIPGTPDAG